MGEIARSKSRIASDLKTRDSNRWRPCDLRLRFETRDWRFVLNTPIQPNCEKGCDFFRDPKSLAIGDWRFCPSKVQFGSVRLRFAHGTVRAVPGLRFQRFPCGKGFCTFHHSLGEWHGSGSGFGFLKNGSDGSGSDLGFWKKRFRRFRFPVPVRFLRHPANSHSPQDTKEYLNQRGTSIAVFRESKKGGQRGEVKGGRSGGRVNRA